MKALSIRQPWAWLIVNGFKDIENRTWSTRFRGPVLIHASKGMTRGEYEDVEDMLDPLYPLHDKRLSELGIKLPPYQSLQRGGIVGIAEIVDCIQQHQSPWFFGDHGFVIRNARQLPFMPFNGALGFFDVPDGAIP